MPKRIAYFECNYCKRQWETHDDADACETRCSQETTCTMCEREFGAQELNRRTDASGFRHRLCMECFEELLAVSSIRSRECQKG